jgi:transposase
VDTLILSVGSGKECPVGRPSKYAPEYRESAVAMVRESGKPIAEVARDLGINEGTLGNWVNADRRRRGEQREDQVSETERAELVRLRRENAQLRMEKEILKKAAAFFVTESTR